MTESNCLCLLWFLAGCLVGAVSICLLHRDRPVVAKKTTTPCPPMQENTYEINAVELLGGPLDGAKVLQFIHHSNYAPSHRMLIPFPFAESIAERIHEVVYQELGGE